MITRDEWLKALGDAVQPLDPDALTIKEIGEMFGINRHKVHARMQAMVAEGKAAMVTKHVPRSSGHPYRAPAYKLLNGNGKKK